MDWCSQFVISLGFLDPNQNHVSRGPYLTSNLFCSNPFLAIKVIKWIQISDFRLPDQGIDSYRQQHVNSLVPGLFPKPHKNCYFKNEVNPRIKTVIQTGYSDPCRCGLYASRPIFGKLVMPWDPTMTIAFRKMHWRHTADKSFVYISKSVPYWFKKGRTES